MTRRQEKRAKIILVMGMTGAGKSYLIRDISGQDVEVGDDLESCTQNIEPITCEIDGELVTILDTPGFDDTKRSDTQVLTDVAEYLAVLYSGDYKVSGIIYLHNIAETRLRGSNVKNLEMFDRLCGKDAYGNVVMLTRGWGLQTTPSALKRELQLKDKHWRDYLVEGCKLDRYQDRDDLIRIFKAMLCNRPVALKIQQEMVVERKGLLETAAGQHINQELIIQKKAFDEELASIIRRYDNETEKMKARLDKMRLEVEAELKKVETDKLMLADTLERADAASRAGMRDLFDQLEKERRVEREKYEQKLAEAENEKNGLAREKAELEAMFSHHREQQRIKKKERGFWNDVIAALLAGLVLTANAFGLGLY